MKRIFFLIWAALMASCHPCHAQATVDSESDGTMSLQVYPGPTWAAYLLTDQYQGFAVSGATNYQGGGTTDAVSGDMIATSPSGVAASFDGLDSNCSQNGSNLLSETKQIRLYLGYLCHIGGYLVGLMCVQITISAWKGWTNA